MAEHSTPAPLAHDTLPVSKIRTDGGTQPRAELSAETIGEYQTAMVAGTTFPPVVVFHDQNDYWLADGFHRLEAAKATGATEIAADVRQGTQRDAILFSVGANAAHGLRRTNLDKRRAVERLLRDGEWAKWSDRKIAEACGVTHPFVGKVRAELTGSGNGYHDREVAPFPCPAGWTLPGADELLDHAWVAWVRGEHYAAVWPSRKYPSFVYVSVMQSAAGDDAGAMLTTTAKPIRADAAWMFLHHLAFPSDAEWCRSIAVPFGYYRAKNETRWEQPWGEDREQSALAVRGAA